MDFGFSPEEEAFRQEVRDFLKKELPSDWGKGRRWDVYADDEAWKFHKVMAKKLGAKGWLSLVWPKEYGGKGLPLIFQFILLEEMIYHRCPGVDIFGVCMLSPILLRFGNEEQRKKHLPGIAKGEVFWCEGYSEPGSGSDLASLQTRAVEEGNFFVINGQKVWTTGAHRADWGFFLVRTDPELARHRGLSFILADMKTPGITVRPIMNMVGEYEFNEIFFDNARVPKENLIGEKNQGWYVALALLDVERSAIPTHITARHFLEDLVAYAKQTKCNGKTLADDPQFKNGVAELFIECEIGRLLSYRALWLLGKGSPAIWESGMAKMHNAEMNQRVGNFAMKVLGMYSQLRGELKAPLGGVVPRYYLRSVGNTIEAGTSEVDRTLIAQWACGLPRE